jgi:creatinine amidohydrolase/Fe(II)-dependent formamide hydrolase-like protein
MAGMTHTRLHRLEQLNLAQIRALDREHTIVLIPIGMLEEHGDHLPLGTDNYAVDALVMAASAWLLDSDPDLHILLLPMIPYGTDPVDRRRTDLFKYAGSVWISAETLRRLVIEVTEHMVRYGFQYIFPLGFHGGAEQSVTLKEACEEIRARYPAVRIYEPMGYVLAGAELDVQPGLATLLGRPLTPQEEVALRGSVHASMFETSLMLAFEPELVSRLYRTLRTISWDQMYTLPDWPGYVGAAPAHANAEVGAAVVRWRGVRAAALIKRAMKGEDLSELPRHPRWYDREEVDSQPETPPPDLAEVPVENSAPSEAPPLDVVEPSEDEPEALAEGDSSSAPTPPPDKTKPMIRPPSDAPDDAVPGEEDEAD